MKKQNDRDKNRTFYLNVARKGSSLVAAVAGLVTAVGALVTAVISAHYSSVAYASRVELMEFTTNDNGQYSTEEKRDEPCATCWRPFKYGFGTKTGTLGIHRQVKFKAEFAEEPQVKCSLMAINLANLRKVVTGLGYVPSKDFGDDDGLDFTSIRVDTSGIQKDRFDLVVSIPLRQKVIAFLENQLSKKALLDESIATEKNRDDEIQNPYATLRDDEIWMINFQNVVGTFDVMCIAQASDGKQRVDKRH
jgi:hypothetical protein